MTERLHFDFSLSCIGEGNGNPLQYSCLENPRDGGAWWAAVYGVAQSRTRLKRLSSSSSRQLIKSRDSTLPTKVCLVKAMVFPVVMYGCESWTIKKAERERINASPSIHLPIPYTSSSNHTYKPLTAAAAAKSLQSCPTLCHHIDGSPQVSPIPGIL